MKAIRIIALLLFLFTLGYSVQKSRVARDAYFKVCDNIGNVRQESFKAVTAEDEAIKELLETAPPEVRQRYADRSAKAFEAKGDLKHHEGLQIRTLGNMLAYMGLGSACIILLYLFRFRREK